VSGHFRPLTWRRRLLIVLLAVAAAVVVVTTLFDPPGGVRRHPPARLDRPGCAAGQTVDCVGGKADVFVVPPAPRASPTS
jgi:hypothetical protein